MAISVLKKLSVTDISAELDNVDRNEVFSLSTMKNECKPLANGRIGLEQHQRSWRRPQSDLCVTFLSLIKETPFIGCKHMFQKLRIAKTTCLRVRHHLEFKKFYLWRAPRLMTENEALVGLHFRRNIFKSCAVPRR
jgi:hypothetical protein